MSSGSSCLSAIAPQKLASLQHLTDNALWQTKILSAIEQQMLASLYENDVTRGGEPKQLYNLEHSVSGISQKLLVLRTSNLVAFELQGQHVNLVWI